ncbi:hypothetical protein ACFYXH_26090 [Streptomyces sp. NPDC002730]|uniref:hypothetical protein n=1 Tax=Streptomyces sp. NPDC002730 TaxID=3364662 RepID=UPI00367DD59D
MTTAQHLDTIDLLRSRGFPAEPGPSDVGTEGPGFHIAELNGHVGQGADSDADGETDAETDAEQRAAEHEALLDALTQRWGEPDYFSLTGTGLRADADEDVPEPWLRLSALLSYLHLWRIDDRWIAIGASETQLLAVVTATDPL